MNFFLIGDKVKNTMRSSPDRDVIGVVASIETEVMALVDYGKGPEKTSIKNLELVGKPTDVQQCLRRDPEALALFADHFKKAGRIEISCQGSRVEKLASDLSSVARLTEIDAVDYIRPVSEASHGAKFDIIVSDDFPAGLPDRLNVFFHAQGERAHEGETQINSRPLAAWLMSTHDVLPRKWEA